MRSIAHSSDQKGATGYMSFKAGIVTFVVMAVVLVLIKFAHISHAPPIIGPEPQVIKVPLNMAIPSPPTQPFPAPTRVADNPSTQ